MATRKGVVKKISLAHFSKPRAQCSKSAKATKAEQKKHQTLKEIQGFLCSTDR